MRLDQALAAKLGMSRRKAREVIASGKVTVNQRPVRIASREVSDGDELSVVDAPASSIPILASGDDWLAVDKPAGMPSQPERDRARTSLEELLRVEHRTIYLVHRLDTPTSGAMLFARTPAAAARLSRLFAEGAIRKTYLAAVEEPFAATIDTPIDGREALTIVRPHGGKLVEVEIKTGRTHQIRRHLASAGHPVIGDRRYGGAPAPRLMLHAWKLEHPSIGLIEAAPPAELSYDPPR